jgi:hypothetical protein
MLLNFLDLAKSFTFWTRVLSFSINKHLVMLGLIEICGAWESSNKYRVCQTECIVLFM